MPPPERNRLITWYLLLKDEWLPAQRQRLADWSQAVREEPRLVWQTPQIRYTVYGLGGLAALWALLWALSLLQPAPPKGARPRANTANIHVVCSNPECKHHFVILRKFGFDNFPVACPRCEQEKGRRAMRCFSSTCDRKLVAPVESDSRLHCSECGADLGAAP
ncbi:MAG: hypothetical protein ACYSVY_18005 [Planctomycetota bacterium]|jgi:hypothetical protein